MRLGHPYVGIVIGVLMASCGSTPFEGFSESENGLYYKLHSIGEGETRARIGDQVTVRVMATTEKDSILFDTRRIGLEGTVDFILEAPTMPKDYREGFLYLSEGDSATFITDAHTFYNRKIGDAVPSGMTVESPVFVHVKLMRIRNPLQYQVWKSEQGSLRELGEFNEKKLLDDYLAGLSKTDMLEPFQNGMYRQVLVKGDSSTIPHGGKRAFYYKGYFLNGRVFDSTKDDHPFEFLPGTEGQLIPGLEAAVMSMKTGEKAKFIIPSHLAFGSEGSSSGMVPPFTTVIYEVELLKGL